MNAKHVEDLRDYFCKIRKQLACYVCGNIIFDPWAVRCGHCYCKDCIKRLVYCKRTCPRCVTYPVIHFNIKKNDEFYKVINQFKKLEAAFEADTNFSLSQDLFQRSHIAYKMDNSENSRSTLSFRDKNSSEPSEILQPSARTDKNIVKERSFGETVVNTTPKNVLDRKSTSETEYFRRYRNVTNKNDSIGSNSSLEEESVVKDQNLIEEESLILLSRSHRVESDEDLQNEEEVEKVQSLSEKESRGQESDLGGSGEEELLLLLHQEKEQNSVFYDIQTLVPGDFQDEEEEGEEKQKLSDTESQTHPSHESDLDESNEDLAGEEEEEVEKEQNSVFYDIETLEPGDFQDEEEEGEDKQNLSDTESQTHPSHESDLDESNADLAGEEEEEVEKEQNSVSSDDSHGTESDEYQGELVKDGLNIDLTEESLRSLKKISGEFKLPSYIEPHTEDVSIIDIESFEVSDSERYKSKEFDRFAESENMVSQSNTETKSVEESVIYSLETYRKVSQRPRTKALTIAIENPSNLIKNSESIPNVPITNPRILLNKSPLNKTTPNFAGKINNNIQFIKMGRINKIKKKKVPFCYCGKLSRYNALDEDSVIALSTNQLKKNPKRSVATQTSPEVPKICAKKRKSEKRKLSANNSEDDLSHCSYTTVLLDDYMKRMKNVDNEKSELGILKKKKFSNNGFVNRIENSETRAIEKMRGFVQEANICETFEVEELCSFDKENQDPFNISQDGAQHYGPGIIEESE